MKPILILLFSFFLSSTIIAQTITGIVISVKDGDSIELLDAEDKIHQIRLAHIDCPEKKQAFGRKARIFTAKFCFGQPVTAIQESTDRYHRKICVVKVGDQELNLALVQAGLAWHFTKYSDAVIYTETQNEARGQKLGLWIEANAVAPWEFRKRKRK